MALIVLATLSASCTIRPSPEMCPISVAEVGLELTVDGTVRAEQRHGIDRGQLHRPFLDRHRAQQLIRALHRSRGCGARRV
jgi:hypothetical protein